MFSIFSSKTAIHSGEIHRTLVLIACLSAFAIILLAGFGIYRLNAHNVILHAEEDATKICVSLAELEKPVLFTVSPDGGYRPSITPAEIPALDKRLRTFLKPFDIVKIKMFSADSQIIFSTDRQIIGKLDSNNLRLKKALKGQVDSQLVNKKLFMDLSDEQMINVNVVETYIPIRDSKNQIIGAMEIYINVSKYHEEIKKGVIYSVLIISGVLLSVFAFSYLLIRKVMFQLKKAHEKLEEFAITDSLTGLFNRRHILERSREEFARIVRLGRAHENAPVLGFLMLDVDNFKTVNDTYGHFTGDDVLVGISKMIGAGCRSYDMAGRYGGEEFLVVLPDILMPDIAEIAERIRTEISQHKFKVDSEKTIAVSVSIGISCCLPGETDIFAALQRSDEGLYLAKRSGKNQVRSVQDELTES
jgi:diguanylate cyclase (GGDEF)-like protein